MASGPAVVTDDCAIVELRRYALHPRAREKLIALFDRELVETQEAVGMRVIGQFRDLDVPDSFVWFRGFRDMQGRKAALTSFYGGPEWAAHRDEANGTMVDSDNVFLLRPQASGAGFVLDGCVRVQPGGKPSNGGHFALTVYHLRRPAEDGFLDAFASRLQPQLAAQGAASVATLITERSANTYPRLPVREGENVLVSVMRLKSSEAYADFRRQVLSHAESGTSEIGELLSREVDVSHLTPTERSLLR